MLSRRTEGSLRRLGLSFRRVVCGAGVALLVAGLSGCASTSSLRAGKAAERLDDFDRAVVEYEKALRAKPDDLTARLSLQRAKLRAAQFHDERARHLAGTGKLEEALIELQIAAELNPASGDIDARLRDLRSQLRAKLAVRTDGKTRLQALVASAAELQPAGLELPKNLTLADSLIFRNASVRDILTAIGHFADINVVFDPQFRDQNITVDLRKTSLEDALQGVTASTRNFYKISAAKTITVIPDTPAKRREYEDEIIKTFFLSNADVKETLDLLRLVVDNRRLSPVAGVNAIAIKDTPDKIAAAARVITAIDKARAEVVIDVELLEVDRSRMHEYGLQLASPGDPPSAGINGNLDANRSDLTLRDLRSLSSADVFVTGLPGLYYRLLKTDGATRTLANPHLRTSDGVPSSARFGEDVPVPSVTFTPLASGGVNQQPITSFTYRTVGVNIELTPRLHHDDDISLRLKLEVSSLSGVGFNNLPTFGTRYVETTIRLRDGETNMLAGLIRDEERTTLEGIPGLSDIPVVGRLFGHTRRETKQTDIVLMLTPRIVRVLDLDLEDLRPFRVGRDSSGGVYELPLPSTQPAPAAPPQDDDGNAPASIFPPGTPVGPPGQVRPIPTPTPTRPQTPPTTQPPTTPTTRPPE
jgi:general secretion pathway protein D